MASSAPGSFKYDVFLNFRGEDTRRTFTSHLRKALDRNQIKSYVDNEMEKGVEIGPALLQAMEESKLSVVILSQKYASSTYCLDELVHILELKERHQQLVIPIFYGVDPSHVENQRKSYAAAFVQHEKHFKDTPDKVLKWRDALTKASQLAGFDSRNISSDAKLVEEVLKDIQEKLNCKYSRDFTPQDVEFSSGQLINGNEHKAKDKCFNCRGIGQCANDCPLAGDEDSPSASDDEESFIPSASDDDDSFIPSTSDDEDSPSASDDDDSSIPSAIDDEDSPSTRDEDSHSTDKCFKCGGIGHWAKDCALTDKCIKCGGIGHWAKDCPSTDKCFKCGGIGHWAKDCSSTDKCFNCPSTDKCFKCGGIGHWAKDCPSIDKCFNCGGIGHWAKDCPSDKCFIR